MRKQYRHLNYTDRLAIKSLLDNKNKNERIANELGVHISTIYREIKRGILCGEYDPSFSQLKYEQELSNKGRACILANDKILAQEISRLILQDKLSPEKVCMNLNAKGISIAPNTIYAAIDNNLIPNVNRKSLKSDITTIFSNGQLHIPTWVRNELNLSDGDSVKLEVKDKILILIKHNAEI